MYGNIQKKPEWIEKSGHDFKEVHLYPLRNLFL